MKITRIVGFVLLVTPLAIGLQGQSLQTKFSDTGLDSIRFAGLELLARGNLMVNRVEFVNQQGVLSNGSVECKRTAEDGGKTQIFALNWGSIKVSYLQTDNRLTLTIDVMNQSPLTLKALSLDALALHFPSTPREYDGKTPLLATNIGAPTLIPLTYRGGSTLVLNDDVKRPLLVGVPWSLNAPAKTIFPVRLNTGRDAMYPDSLPYIDRPIPPGKRDSLRISLLFSASDSDFGVSARNVLKDFAGLDEFAVRWPDRRPIGSLILATAGTKWAGNPRGWLLDPKIDIHSEAGVAEFHKRVLAWADHSIAILRKMNAQGMVTWDIEGEEFPQPTTYIGDAAASAKLAPEMAGIVDEYFSRFVKAGLRVGVTIRPQRLDQSGGMVRQVESADPAQELIRKIAFAKKRWGATLFYIDSNGDAVRPLSFEAVSKAARAFPDVLLIPEHKNVAYYSRSAPYYELRGGNYATPVLVRSIYPNSFSVINTADGDVQKHATDLLWAVNRGDILMFRGWFDDPPNAAVKAIYEKAHFSGGRQK